MRLSYVRASPPLFRVLSSIPVKFHECGFCPGFTKIVKNITHYTLYIICYMFEN